MSTETTNDSYLLYRVDPATNTLIDYDYVLASSRGEAIKARPDGWTRAETRTRKDGIYGQRY